MKNRIALILVFSIVLLMGLSACGAIQSVAEVNDLGSKFFSALRNNDPATAWFMLTEDIQKEVGGEQGWVEFVKLRNFSNWSFTDTKVNSVGAQIDGEASLGKDIYSITLVFDKSSGNWLIAGLNFNRQE